MRLPRLLPVLALACALATSACDGGDSDAGEKVVSLSPGAAGAAAHSHKVIGDGTTPAAGGYRLQGVRVTRSSDRVGQVSFRVLDPKGSALTDYTADQTKLLHLYVVREDLAVFRHLHPTMADDGTWRGAVDLDQPGRYRVVAEFIPKSHTDLTPVVLGQDVRAPGSWNPEAVPSGASASDGVVAIDAPRQIRTGFDRQLELTVSDGEGQPVNLGTYLGAYAHLTGFDIETGKFIHAHPLGEPTVGSKGSTLQFHVTLQHPGRYRFFVQVRVDGFLHSLALTVPVVPAAT